MPKSKLSTGKRLNQIAILLLALLPACNVHSNSTISQEQKEEIVKHVSDSLNQLQTDRDAQIAQKTAQLKAQEEERKENDCRSKIVELNRLLSQTASGMSCSASGITGNFDDASTYAYNNPEHLTIPFSDIVQIRIVNGYDEQSPTIHIMAYGKWRLLVQYGYLSASRYTDAGTAKSYQANNKEVDSQIKQVSDLLRDIIKYKTNRAI